MQIIRVDHVSFTVGDIERSAAFYSQFGFEKHKEYLAGGSDTSDACER